MRILRSTSGAATSPEPNATQTQAYEGLDELFTDTGLTNGTTYYYTIYARDDAGNYSASVSSSATPEDTTAPNTILDDTGPSGTVNSASATFDFSATEDGSTFECRLDGAAFSACDSGIEYTNLSEGSHTPEVRAKDGAGNADASPATRTWTVDTTVPVDPTAPTVTATTPSGRKVSPKANVTAKFSELMDQTSVETLGAVKLAKKGTTRSVAAVVSYIDATNTVTLDPTKSLRKGATYTATVSIGAKDKAGNALASSKTWSFRVRP